MPGFKTLEALIKANPSILDGKGKRVYGQPTAGEGNLIFESTIKTDVTLDQLYDRMSDLQNDIANAMDEPLFKRFAQLELDNVRGYEYENKDGEMVGRVTGYINTEYMSRENLFGDHMSFMPALVNWGWTVDPAKKKWIRIKSPMFWHYDGTHYIDKGIEAFNEREWRNYTYASLYIDGTPAEFYSESHKAPYMDLY